MNAAFGRFPADNNGSAVVSAYYATSLTVLFRPAVPSRSDSPGVRVQPAFAASGSHSMQTARSPRPVSGSQRR